MQLSSKKRAFVTPLRSGAVQTAWAGLLFPATRRLRYGHGMFPTAKTCWRGGDDGDTRRGQKPRLQTAETNARGNTPTAGFVDKADAGGGNGQHDCDTTSARDSRAAAASKPVVVCPAFTCTRAKSKSWVRGRVVPGGGLMNPRTTSSASTSPALVTFTATWPSTGSPCC